MATNDERRRLADNMRVFDVVADGRGRYWLNGTLFGMDVSARSEEDMRTGMAHLASFIEPPLQCPHYDSSRHYCSVHDHVVDRDALLALASDIDKQTDGSMFDALLEDGHYIARRIREAVGA